MKKSILVVGALAVMFGLMFWADVKFQNASKPTVRAADAAKPAPEVTLKDLAGSDVSLAQYRGKVVLLNFWATWCEPCRIEIPWLIEFQQKYGPRGFIVLGVAMDDEGKKVVESFVQRERFDVDGRQMAMNYPILLGNDEVADKFGGLIGIPTSALITRDGKVVNKIIGLVNHDRMAKEIEAQL